MMVDRELISIIEKYNHDIANSMQEMQWQDDSWYVITEKDGKYDCMT